MSEQAQQSQQQNIDVQNDAEALQNQAQSMSAKEAIAYLAEKFPLCFTVEGEAKPLKIGLFQDLAAALENDDKVSKTVLRHALRSYTMGWRYLACCTADAVRVDLNGEPAGVVDAQQAEHAAQSLAEAKAAYAQKREQARKEQRKAFFKQKAREEQGNKPKENRPAKRKPRVAEPPQESKRVEKEENLQILPADKVVKGAKVRVKVGSQAQPATILELEKQNVRVQLASGLTMTVSPEHLFY